MIVGKSRFQNIFRASEPTEKATEYGKDTKGELLKQLKRLSDVSGKRSCKKVLKAIFESCLAKDEWDDKQKVYIGKTLFEKLNTICIYIIHFCYFFDTTHVMLALIFRSALQFMLDDYGNFPTNDEDQVLKKALMEIIGKENAIEDLDKVIDFWKENRKFGYDFDDYSREELRKPKGIQDFHCWWDI